MNTIENNKSIAEFMGGIFVTYKDEEQVKIKVPRNSIIQMPFWNLAYDSDWEWLMEVVEKIELLPFKASYDTHNFTVLIEANGCTITSREVENWENIYGNSYLFIDSQHTISKIEAVYSACVDFIKWYNLQEGV